MEAGNVHGDFDNFFNLFIGSISIILELYINHYNFCNCEGQNANIF